MFKDSAREPEKTQRMRWVITFLLSGAAVCASFLVTPFFRDPVNTSKIFFLLGVAVFAVVVLLGGLLIVPFFILRRSLFNGLLIITSLFLVISSLASYDPSLSFFGRGETFVLSSAAFIAWILIFFIIIQTIRLKSQWYIYYSAVLGGATFAVVVPVLCTWSSVALGIMQRPLAQAASNVAVIAAILVVLHAGPVLTEQVKWRRFLHTICFVLVGVVLFQLGFTVAWLLSIFGLLVLMVAQSTHMVNRFRLIMPFTMIVVGIISVVFGSPTGTNTLYPTEISLGSSASWQIVSGVLHHTFPRALLGTGLGTFVYDFAQYRTPAFNVDQLVATVYFQNGYSTFLTLLLEIGWIGVLLFAAIGVVGVGYLLLVFRHISFTEKISEGMERLLNIIKSFQKPVDTEHMVQKTPDTESYRLPISRKLRPELITVGVGWILLSFAFLFSFAEVATWWLWWGLLGLIATGVEIAQLSTRTKEMKLRVSFDTPQATLGFFVVLVLLFSSIAAGAFGIRLALAEYTNMRADEVQGKERLAYLLQAQAWNSTADRAIALSNEYVRHVASLSSSSSIQADVFAENFAPAIAAAKQATELSSANFRTWENSGVLYMQVAPFLPAALPWSIDSLTRALSLAPTNYSISWQLGNAYAMAQNTKKAEEMYRQAIALKPDFLPAHVALSELYEQNEQIDKAIAVYEPIIPIVRTNPELLFRLGRLFYNRNQKQDYDRAEAVWLQAITILPDFSNALYSLGALYEKKGTVSEAVKYYRRVAELNPKNSDIQAKIHQLGG